ncbi:Cerato-platanin-domain-containing protein [Dichomitus squalens]|uniref:Cerato-platanin-domain-containing protein n=1 Tax=Dichomitus squalens TaxID=114155 RepID=A0A4Q9MBY8_9APHY|nr:Cerato-platanin-domain-containing protein [Dichomitus squalens]
MQFLSLSAGLLFLSTVLAQTGKFNTNLTYDQIYDDGDESTQAIACSNGANGVIDKEGALTLSEIIGWPNIAGAPAIKHWNSPNCSTCWELTYNDAILHVFAIDTATDGFNVGLNVMNNLTNGSAVALGRVAITAVQVLATACEQESPRRHPPPSAP